MPDVVPASREEVVDTKDIVAEVQQIVGEVTPDKTGTAGDQYAPGPGRHPCTRFERWTKTFIPDLYPPLSLLLFDNFRITSWQ